MAASKEKTAKQVDEKIAKALVTKAKIDFIRQTARKVRRTANLIRGMKTSEALLQLKFLPYAAAKPLKKLLESAMANAKNNNSVDNPEELVISQLLIDDGPIMKRWRAQSRGRAASVYKRTSQARIVLSELSPQDYATYERLNPPVNASSKKTPEEKALARAAKESAKAASTAKAPKAEKKPAAKKTTKKAEEKKPATKKPAAKKTTKKAEEKKPAAKKKTIKKKDEK